MSRNYDNWERLVAATLDREKLRELALLSSRETSFSSSISARFNSPYNFKFGSELYDRGNPDFGKALLLANQVVRLSENTASFKQECLEIKSKAEKVAMLLRAASMIHDLYDRPARRVMDATENVLKKAVSLVLKCRGLKRVFASITSASFEYISSELQHCIGNISWLLRDDMYCAIPPIAADEPVLCNIWELIAVLHTGSDEDRCNAVASLVSLTGEGDAYIKLIVEEGGTMQPLLRLVEQGTPEARENAVTIITLMGKENRYVMVPAVSSVFMRVLEEAHLTKLQGTVAWAISELAWLFRDDERLSFVHVLVRLGLLCKVSVTRSSGPVSNKTKGNSVGYGSGTSLYRGSNRATDKTDLSTTDYIQEMATKGLWHLALASKGCCQVIAKRQPLICFTFFLYKGTKEAQYNSAMALTRITAVAEHDTELRKTVFKLHFPLCKILVDQLILIMDNEGSEILIPCVKVIGNLAKTFKATETRMIGPLVKLLDEKEAEVSMEACVALTKFAKSNFLCVERSKAIVNNGGVKFLVQLVYSGEEIVQQPALILLCYIVLNAPFLATTEVVFSVLQWASRQVCLTQDEGICRSLLPHAIRRASLILRV